MRQVLNMRIEMYINISKQNEDKKNFNIQISLENSGRVRYIKLCHITTSKWVHHHLLSSRHGAISTMTLISSNTNVGTSNLAIIIKHISFIFLFPSLHICHQTISFSSLHYEFYYLTHCIIWMKKVVCLQEIIMQMSTIVVVPHR